MSDILQTRQEKLELLKKNGIAPYGGRFETTARIKDLIASLPACRQAGATDNASLR